MAYTVKRTFKIYLITPSSDMGESKGYKLSMASYKEFGNYEDAAYFIETDESLYRGNYVIVEEFYKN